MLSETLAAHLRKTWSYDGLEVVGVSADGVTATVPPSFPISELCMDVGNPDTFDAVVSLQTSPKVLLEITPAVSPSRESHGGWLASIVVAAIAVACWMCRSHLVSLYDSNLMNASFAF